MQGLIAIISVKLTKLSIIVIFKAFVDNLYNWSFICSLRVKIIPLLKYIDKSFQNWKRLFSLKRFCARKWFDKETNEQSSFCFTGYAMQFLFLSAFSWLNVICFNIWWSIRWVTKHNLFIFPGGHFVLRSGHLHCICCHRYVRYQS